MSYIRKIPSKINGTLEITWLHGKKVLNSAKANYSYGSLQRTLDDGLSNIYFDSKAKVLVLGMGGGSVIDTLRNKYNHSGHIPAVEIDPVIIEVAKVEFKITEHKNLSIISDNALHFVSNIQSSFDLIIIDLFIDMEVPIDFYETRFWDSVILLIKSKGTVLFNAGIHLRDNTNLQSIIARYTDTIEFQIYDNIQGTNTLLIGRKK